MSLNKKTVGTGTIFIVLLTVLGLCPMPLASAADDSKDKPAALQSSDIKKVQEALHEKGYYKGQIDGILGSQTRAGIRQYQKSENLPVTGHLDAKTAGKLGVGPESIGGEFKGAGHEVGKGGEEAGHEIKQGKPVAAGKEMGKGVGRAGEKVGEGVKKAVSPESDRGDREKKQEDEKQANPQ
jgi:peptidoglycan hydrolase-like protein with peptidoglycan-binding domain